MIDKFIIFLRLKLLIFRGLVVLLALSFNKEMNKLFSGTHELDISTPLVMGILVIGAGLTLIGNLLADLCYALADPRIRHGGR